MKKIFIGLLIFVVIIAAALEIILPRTVTSILKEQIAKSTHAQDVALNMYSVPNAKILLGQVDEVHGTANSGELGDVEFEALTLDAKKVSVDVMELIFPTNTLNSKQRTEKILKSAENIELSGIITADGLKNFIEDKVDHLDDAKIKITPQEVSATGQVKILGQTADVDIAGSFILDNGDIYFHVTGLNVRNALVRHVQMDRFLGDLKVLQSSQLPIGLKFSSVQMRDGDVLITATRQ